MLRRFLCQVDIELHIIPRDPLLVKAGYATLDTADMVPVSTMRNGEQTHYLPGTSLKGVLRSHFERIARSLAPGSVCLPYYDPRRTSERNIPVESERRSYGCGFRNREAALTSERYRESCAACRLFGSLKYGGRFTIGDAYPLPGHKPTVEHRHGVGIDRFTGGTVQGVLFDQCVLVGGRYGTSVQITNFEQWQLAAALVLVNDMRDELIPIGSGRSRGLGRVTAEVTSVRISYTRPVDRLVGLAELVDDAERAAYGLHAWQPSEPIPLPEPQRRGIRLSYDLTEQWERTMAALLPGLIEYLTEHSRPGEKPQPTRS